MTYKIDEIEGIGASYAEKLKAASIMTTADLLKSCGTASGRKNVAASTGIGEGTLLKWANMADLMRVSGVGKQYAELLHAAGVDTIKELRMRNAENLAQTMQQLNEQKKLTKGAAGTETVSKWIAEAKRLDPSIHH